MQDIIQKIRESLNGIYPDSEIASLSRLVIEHVTGQSMPSLLTDKSKQITAAEELKIDKIVEQLKRLEPIQYILGETEFFGLPFLVDRSVLIPRPETEELVELILAENRAVKLNILDIGTGSGSIAISLKKYLPDVYLEAWDFSEKALHTARLNAGRNKTDIVFKQVDVLGNYPTYSSFDIIVSNPPYVLNSEKATMSTNVLDYEPHSALFVPDNDPLLFYNRIADISMQLFKEKGKLYFEINQMKGEETASMLNKKGYTNVQVVKDISGNDRIVKAEFHKAL